MAGKLKFEYNRDERRRMTGWREPQGDRRDIKKSRRITFIDMVVILIFFGLLYPLIQQREGTVMVNGYRVRSEMTAEDGSAVIRYSIRAARNPQPPGTLFEITVTDEEGTVLAEQTDILPEGEAVRIVLLDFSTENTEGKISSTVSAGSSTGRITHGNPSGKQTFSLRNLLNGRR
jgi:hypothetical protein